MDGRRKTELFNIRHLGHDCSQDQGQTMEALRGVCTKPATRHHQRKVHVTCCFKFLIRLRIHVLPEYIIEFLPGEDDIRKRLHLPVNATSQWSIAVKMEIRNPQLFKQLQKNLIKPTGCHCFTP